MDGPRAAPCTFELSTTNISEVEFGIAGKFGRNDAAAAALVPVVAAMQQVALFSFSRSKPRTCTSQARTRPRRRQRPRQRETYVEANQPASIGE